MIYLNLCFAVCSAFLIGLCFYSGVSRFVWWLNVFNAVINTIIVAASLTTQ